MSVLSVLCVNMVTANMLLSLFFLSGALADCASYTNLFITAPKKMEALSGSCLQIPCNCRAKSGQEFDSKSKMFGVWFKNDPNFKDHPEKVIFNRSVNTHGIKITGKLREKNCSTLVSTLNTSYTDIYYFRIESESFTATAVCDPLQITVTDSPRHPTIEISGDLKEKESVTITCSAFTPCPHSPPKLTWNLQQHSHNKLEENTDGTFTTKIQETITLSDQHDGYNISCSATYPVNEGKDVKTAEETKTLSVSYAPKDTSVSISASAGSWVNLTCSSRAKPPVSSFTWFRNSEDGPMKVAEGHFYSVINVTDGGDYYCVATNHLGNQTSSQIHLNGSESSAVLGPAHRGIIVTLIILIVCVAVYVWYLKSKHQTPQQTQSQRQEELADQLPPSIAGENIHYGEIDFSKRRPEPSSDSVQDSGQQQDTVYAQVNVSEPANTSRQTADGPEDLYAQVKKK